MSTYIPVYIDNQIVDTDQMNNPFYTVFTGVGNAYSDRTLPIIVSGLTLAVDGSGLATVQPGVVVGDAYTNSTNPAFPANGINVYATLDSESTVQVTAETDEYGWIILRETLTPVTGPINGGGSGTVGYTVSTSLVYEAGSDTAYPVSRAPHDTILAGVITVDDGGSLTYYIDYSQRAEDDAAIAASIQQNHLTSDPYFYPFAAISPLSVNEGEVKQLTNLWWGFVDSGSSATSFTQYFLGTSEALGIPGAPTSAVTISRAAGSSSGREGVRQQIQYLGSVMDQWCNLSFWADLTSATSTVQVTLRLVQNGTVVHMSNPITLTLGAGWKLYSVPTFFNKVIFDSLLPTDIYHLDVAIYAPSTSYSVTLTSVFPVNGYQYSPPSSPLVDRNSFRDNLAADRIGTYYGYPLSFLIPSACGLVEHVTSNGEAPVHNAINVASVTRSAEGVYEITFADAMPGSNYLVLATPIGGTVATTVSLAYNVSPTENAFTLHVMQANLLEDLSFYFVVLRGPDPS